MSPRRCPGRCVYCGGYTTGKLACRGHADLPSIDPFYSREARAATTDHWTPGATTFAADRLVEHVKKKAAA